MPLYFAYGSNMDLKQMSERCPGAKFYGVGYLLDYKLGFTRFSLKRKGAVADVLVSPGDYVWGIIYEMTQEEIQQLDRYEGVPGAYRRLSEEVMFREKSHFDREPIFPPKKNFLPDEVEWNESDLSEYSEVECHLYVVVEKNMKAGSPSFDYLQNMLQVATEYSFAEPYIQTLISFLKPVIDTKRSNAANFLRDLLDEIQSPEFEEKVKDCPEWGGAELIITGNPKRVERIKKTHPDDVIVFTKYWKELSWTIDKIYHCPYINWQITWINKYVICAYLGHSAITFQKEEKKNRRPVIDHQGLCESVILAAYIALT